MAYGGRGIPPPPLLPPPPPLPLLQPAAPPTAIADTDVVGTEAAIGTDDAIREVVCEVDPTLPNSTPHSSEPKLQSELYNDFYGSFLRRRGHARTDVGRCAAMARSDSCRMIRPPSPAGTTYSHTLHCLFVWRPPLPWRPDASPRPPACLPWPACPSPFSRLSAGAYLRVPATPSPPSSIHLSPQSINNFGERVAAVAAARRGHC